YSTLFRILRHLNLTPSDVFVDLGCGLGRSIFSASWLGAKRAVGVEIEGQLVEQAGQNRSHARWRTRDIDFVHQSAEEYMHAETTVIFMFHPFGAGTMANVIRGLERTLADRPRHLRIAYLNPVHGQVLDASEQLVRIGHWPERQRERSGNGHYGVGFWAAKNGAERISSAPVKFAAH
ncbi:MAG: methyltransferase domain-containing protein, partial [Burkholderiaceae bacterium]